MLSGSGHPILIRTYNCKSYAVTFQAFIAFYSPHGPGISQTKCMSFESLLTLTWLNINPNQHNILIIPNITYLQSLLLWIYTLHAWLICRWIYDICLSLLSSTSSPPMQTTLPSISASQWPPRHHQRGAHPDTEGRPRWHTTVCWGTVVNLSFDFWCDDDVLPWEELYNNIFYECHKESVLSFTVSVTSHHREAGLRCSECEAGLAADSGERKIFATF